MLATPGSAVLPTVHAHGETRRPARAGARAAGWRSGNSRSVPGPCPASPAAQSTTADRASARTLKVPHASAARTPLLLIVAVQHHRDQHVHVEPICVPDAARTAAVPAMRRAKVVTIDHELGRSSRARIAQKASPGRLPKPRRSAAAQVIQGVPRGSASAPAGTEPRGGSSRQVLARHRLVVHTDRGVPRCFACSFRRASSAWWPRWMPS